MLTISKQLTCQRYIYKIHSSRLRKNKWNLTLPLSEARKNDEVISLASSQTLRWIDSLNEITEADQKALMIRSEIRKLRREPNSVKNRHEIKKLYEQLDVLQYKKDYVSLIIDKEKDYYRACKGFYINGIKYKRLLGTNGGIKNSTIVFASENLSEELNRRISNGRNRDIPFVTAKLEAYQALTCSASTPVSFPNGIAVVNDCETSFMSDILYLTDECDGEPIMEFRKDQEVNVDASDGFGLILPSLAKRWSEELQLDYVLSGANTRFSFEKGMGVAFDYVEFAEKVAGTYIVKDAWGNDFDVRDVEFILTTSMVKLWDSYDSCEDYVTKSIENGYTFGIAKTCPRELENERSLNYQFIQSYDLDDEDIEELITPTMNEIKDVLRGDWRKTILFLKGMGLSEKNIEHLNDDFIKSIMIDKRMLDDPFVQNSIYQMIKNRINEAKVGVLKVHGNYSIACGDPYALCQSMFGMEVTGLLKSGEIFNQYWRDYGSERLACFRAPMTCHNNIKMVYPANREDVNYWYRYMKTCTVFNAWDTTMAALNGMDFDGDIVMLTDNNVLVNRLEPLPSLMCAQRKAQKKISSEEDFIKSNIESFGNDIGATTNHITSMFEVQSHFPKGSDEYNELSYRIRCGQLYQQNAIDKAKGIICKPMPKTWYDRHSVNRLENDYTKNFYKRIVAEKKPYFMIYIYPAMKKQYKEYIKNTNKNCLREFRITIDELKKLPEEKLTSRQEEFLKYYNYKMPVGTGDCVMNKICRRFENEFDGYLKKHNSTVEFNYSIMRDPDAHYSQSQYKSIKNLYEEYIKKLKDYKIFVSNERIDKSDASTELIRINEDFRRSCDAICQNEKSLCNILLDLCYTRNSSKRFVWSVCGSEIIHNLLARNNNEIKFPVASSDGDIYFCGEFFKIVSKKIGVNEWE